jgi:uncharacterized protein YndB with AHSA1/START domain
MAAQDIDVRATLDAPPDRAYELLDDSSSWPTWTAIDSFELVEPAGGDGLGEIRRFRTGRVTVTVTERIVARVPGRRLSYVLLGGLAVSEYRADIDLEPTGSGTALRWHTTFQPKVPGTGWIYRRALLIATRRFVAGLQRAVAVR